MNDQPCQLSSRQTLLLILIPLLATFACQRCYLHLVGVTHVYPGGFLIHHLFFGVALVIPAAFLLAFGPRKRRTAVVARVALGSGSAMILDEIVYLVATKATDADYISPLSLRGAIVFIALGVFLLLFLYRLQPVNSSPHQP